MHLSVYSIMVVPSKQLRILALNHHWGGIFMAEPTGLWGRMLAAVNRVYERRIRAASLVTEYGAAHGAHHSHEEEEGDAAEILNLPRGSRLGSAFHSADHAHGHKEPPAH